MNDEEELHFDDALEAFGRGELALPALRARVETLTRRDPSRAAVLRQIAETSYRLGGIDEPRYAQVLTLLGDAIDEHIDTGEGDSTGTRVRADEAVNLTRIGTSPSSKSEEADVAGEEMEIGEGTVLAGRYRLERCLGVGGMGTVYVAQETTPGLRETQVAIKVLRPEYQHDREIFRALHEEVLLTRDVLTHENIVGAFSVDRDGPVVFMVMQYVEAKSLAKLLDEDYATGMPYAHAWPIIEQIALALSYAHGKGVIHSDMKPSNVLVGHGAKVKVIDFGIARSVRHRSGGGVHTALPGAFTPEYASCEMLEGDDGHPQDDVYAFGCVVYEMLTGRHPFDYVCATEAERKQLPYKPVGTLTKRQDAALRKALAFRRHDRALSIEEVRQGLSPPQPSVPAGVKRALLAVAGAAAVVLIATIGWQMLPDDVAPYPPTDAAPVTVTVSRSPPTAAVLVGSEEVTSSQLVLTPGTYSWVATAPGYYGATGELRVEGPDTRLDVQLSPVSIPSFAEYQAYAMRERATQLSAAEIRSIAEPTLRTVLELRYLELSGRSAELTERRSRLEQLAARGDARAAVARVLLRASYSDLTPEVIDADIQAASRNGDALATLVSPSPTGKAVASPRTARGCICCASKADSRLRTNCCGATTVDVGVPALQAVDRACLARVPAVSPGDLSSRASLECGTAPCEHVTILSPGESGRGTMRAMPGMDAELAQLSVKQLFELSRHGLLWLDATGRVVLMNDVARRILSQEDGIRVRDGRLSFARPQLTRELDAFIARANRLGEAFTERLTVRVERPSGASAYLLVLMPWAGNARGGAFVVLEDFGAKPPLGPELCRQLYGLTSAELRVALHVLDGRSVPDISSRLSLSPYTVRTHIKRVFKKVGVHSQAQLMAVLCRLAFLPLGSSHGYDNGETLLSDLPQPDK